MIRFAFQNQLDGDSCPSAKEDFRPSAAGWGAAETFRFDFLRAE